MSNDIPLFLHTNALIHFKHANFKIIMQAETVTLFLKLPTSYFDSCQKYHYHHTNNIICTYILCISLTIAKK